MQIHHISMLAADAQKNFDFYTKVLGLRLVKNTVNQENFSLQHLFYGDYTASPGSVLTFFVVPFLGKRTDGNHHIDGAYLGIPKGSLDWWASWLTDHDVAVQRTDQQLSFTDSDQFNLVMQETEQTLSEAQINPDSPVPAKNQIVHILGNTWVVPDLPATEAFYHDWLGLTADANHRISLATDQFIQLRQTDQPTTRTRFGRGSTDHLALSAENEDQLLDYWELAKTQGYHLEMYRDRFWFKSIYVKDPGDNRLELATMGPGFTRDEPLDQLGKKISLPPWIEPKRAEIEAKIPTFD